AELAAKTGTWKFNTWCYIFQSSYGSPEVDHKQPTVSAAVVSEDRRSVRLTLSEMTRGHIHELRADVLKSAAGTPLLHPTAYYTLHYLPDAQ
ncbi:MAG: hypothetical protein RL215_3477, partial [Planctomycetota bacterium]